MQPPKSNNKLIYISAAVTFGFFGLFLIVSATFPSLDERLAALNQSTSSSAAGGVFTETFDGFPASPQPFTQIGQSTWDVAIHSRDGYWASPNTWDTLEPMTAHHGVDCSKPISDTNPGNPVLVTHPLNGVYEDYVFKCRDHVMTSITAGGYGLVALAPNNMIDFSTGEAVLKFDMSTWRSAGRDWVDLWISPFQENIQLPFDDSSLGAVDLQGGPINGVHINMGLTDNSFSAQVIRNGSFQSVNGGGNANGGYDGWLTQDAARRDTFELRISSTHIKFGMPTYNKWWVDTNINALNWSQGVVQLAHHSYNPTKDCGVANMKGPDGACKANTWHWDNVSISPAKAFTIIKADRRFAKNNDTITFAQPAPANSYLRFTGIGSIKVSFNGATAQNARKQPSTKTGGAEHFNNYWMPIPVGTKTVKFQISADSYVSSDSLRGKDFAIWSLESPTSVTTAPTTTVVPTNTNTPTNPPTVTTTVRPTNSPTPSRTPTPTIPGQPTFTPSPTATKTPSPTANPTTPTPTTLPPMGGPGDVNGDRVVNIKDLGIVVGYYGLETSSNPNNELLQRSDLNKNGIVDIFDLGIIASNYRKRY